MTQRPNQVPLRRLRLAAAIALLVPVFCSGGDAAPVWSDPVMVRRGGNNLELLTPEKADKIREKKLEAAKPPPPIWIGDCCYYADGSYYHKDGSYWLPDLKTHYVYAEKCWHLANGGVLTDTGIYYPPVTAPAGLLGLPLRLAAVMTSLAGGAPIDPGTPPEEPEPAQ